MNYELKTKMERVLTLSPLQYPESGGEILKIHLNVTNYCSAIYYINNYILII
jgi:hypothetical protein